jgi:hypothetical protein
LYDWETEDRLAEEDGNPGRGLVVGFLLALLFWGVLFAFGAFVL